MYRANESTNTKNNNKLSTNSMNRNQLNNGRLNSKLANSKSKDELINSNDIDNVDKALNHKNSTNNHSNLSSSSNSPIINSSALISQIKSVGNIIQKMQVTNSSKQQIKEAWILKKER